jgi:hypothetical protein
MNKLVLIPQEVHRNDYGVDEGYGMVRFQRENAKGVASERLVCNVALWDALRRTQKSERQKRLIKALLRRG